MSSASPGSHAQTAPFSGTTALVVGASGGIGRAVARELHRLGAEVRIHGRDRRRIEALVTELQRNGGRAHPVVQVLEPDAPLDAAVETVLAGDVPDIVVVSYGPFIEQQLLQTDGCEWRRLYEANVMLPVLLGQRCLPTMMQRGFGRMLVFGGTGTDQIRGYRTIGAYSAVKTALMSWVKSAAAEVAGRDVAVSAICPGYVETEYLDQAALARYSRRVAGGRLSTPQEVAYAAVTLLDPRSALMNGAVIALDGAGATAVRTI
ncbi:MAG: SDR family oxidoreductase [Spirochaetaceae bacterium]|nr:MAG: SDR family oxidoreductase [Spirochaetaceae bacterium]